MILDAEDLRHLVLPLVPNQVAKAEALLIYGI